MHLKPDAVELPLDRRLFEQRNGVRDRRARRRQHRLHGLERPQPERSQRIGALRERGHRRGWEIAREHGRPPNGRERETGGAGDGVGHHAGERALTQLADEQARRRNSPSS